MISYSSAVVFGRIADRPSRKCGRHPSPSAATGKFRFSLRSHSASLARRSDDGVAPALRLGAATQPVAVKGPQMDRNLPVPALVWGAVQGEGARVDIVVVEDLRTEARVRTALPGAVFEVGIPVSCTVPGRGTARGPTCWMAATGANRSVAAKATLIGSLFRSGCRA